MPRPMPKFTKTPPELIAAFDAAMPADPRVVRKTMFGYPAYFVNGNMLAFTFGPRVAVRVDDARRKKLGDAGGAFEIMPGRAMREYVEVPANGLTGAALRRWIADAFTHTAALPAKTATKTATKAAAKTAARTTTGRPSVRKGRQTR